MPLPSLNGNDIQCMGSASICTALAMAGTMRALQYVSPTACLLGFTPLVCFVLLSRRYLWTWLWFCWACVSIGSNRMGEKGAQALARVFRHLPVLTVLEYVPAAEPRELHTASTETPVPCLALHIMLSCSVPPPPAAWLTT